MSSASRAEGAGLIHTEDSGVRFSQRQRVINLEEGGSVAIEETPMKDIRHLLLQSQGTRLTLLIENGLVADWARSLIGNRAEFLFLTIYSFGKCLDSPLCEKYLAQCAPALEAENYG